MVNNISKKLEEFQDSQFENKLNTTEGYEKVVDSFKNIEDLVSPEFQEQLNKYKEGLLALCSDHMSVTNNPEVQAVIAESNNEFLTTFGKAEEIKRKREYRGILIESSNNPYFS